MFSRSEKEALVAGVADDIGKAQAVFLTNLIGVTSNQSVDIRKSIRAADGKVFVTRNTLFAHAAKGTSCEKLLSDLKGPHALAFAFSDAAAVAKCIKDASKEMPTVELLGGVLEGKELSAQQVIELASLPSRDQMLGTLLATFMAPISAFARVMHAIGETKEEVKEIEEVKEEVEETKE